MKANSQSLELQTITQGATQIEFISDWRGYFLQAYIMIALALIAAYLFSIITNRSGFIFRRKRKIHCEKPGVSFSIEVATCPIISQYVDKMSDQYKDNSRILNGSGKTHFTEAVVEGSDTVRSESLSILSAIGERFS